MLSEADNGETGLSHSSMNSSNHLDGSLNNLDNPVTSTPELMNSTDQTNSNIEPTQEDSQQWSFEDSNLPVKSNEPNGQDLVTGDCCTSNSITLASYPLVSPDVAVQTFIPSHAQLPVPVPSHFHAPFSSNMASSLGSVPAYGSAAATASPHDLSPSTLMNAGINAPTNQPHNESIHFQSLQRPRAPSIALPLTKLQNNGVSAVQSSSSSIGDGASVMAAATGSFNSVRTQFIQQNNSNAGMVGENLRPGSTGSGDHFVMVHVDAGETFSVRVDDKIQHIPGPATVRMVCNSGPPFPMPMQVPPGHVVQQIIDENGILTHVILSSYPGPTHPSLQRGMAPSVGAQSMPAAESVNGMLNAPGTGANLIIDPTHRIQVSQGALPHQHISTASPATAGRGGPLTLPLNPYAHAAHHHVHPHPHHPHQGLQHATAAHAHYHPVPYIPHHPAAAHFHQQFQHLTPSQPLPQQHVCPSVAQMHAKHVLPNNSTVPLTTPLNEDGGLPHANLLNSAATAACHTNGSLTNGCIESSLPPTLPTHFEDDVQKHDVQQTDNFVVQQEVAEGVSNNERPIETVDDHLTTNISESSLPNDSLQNGSINNVPDSPEGCNNILPALRADETQSNVNILSNGDQSDNGTAARIGSPQPPSPPTSVMSKSKAADGTTLEGPSELQGTQPVGESGSLLPLPHSHAIAGTTSSSSTSGSKRKRSAGNGKHHTGFRSSHPRPASFCSNRPVHTVSPTSFTSTSTATSLNASGDLNTNGRRPERSSWNESEFSTLLSTAASHSRQNSIPPRLKGRRSQQSTPTTATHPSTFNFSNNLHCSSPHHSSYNQVSKSDITHYPTGVMCKNPEYDPSTVAAMDTATTKLEEPTEDNLLLLDAERGAIVSILSNIQPPQVSEVELHSAVIQLTLPSCLSIRLPRVSPRLANQTGTKSIDDPGCGADTVVVPGSDSTLTTESKNASTDDARWVHLNQNEIQFELHLAADRDTASRFKCIFEGEATHISLKELTPGSDYYIKTCCVYNDLCGSFSSTVHFVTLSSEPTPPKMLTVTGHSRNSLNVKWSSAQDNGSRITSYRLEYAVQTTGSASGLPKFIDGFCGMAKSCQLTELSSNTTYLIRVMAVNAQGPSRWSSVITASTSGSPPPVPRTPFLVAADVHSLTLAWHRHPDSPNFLQQSTLSASLGSLNNVNYTLEMDDEAMEHGFVTVFDGTGIDHCIENLRRNTRYRFRLSASNVDGRSRCSDVVSYSTLPDRPSPPQNLRLSSPLRSAQLTFTWDIPEDDGGFTVQAYRLEMRLPFVANANFDMNAYYARSFYSSTSDSNQLTEEEKEHSDDFRFLCWPHVTGMPSKTTFASIPPLSSGTDSSAVRPKFVRTSQLTGLPASFGSHSIWHALCQLPINADDNNEALNDHDNERCGSYHRQRQSSSPVLSDEQQHSPDNESTSHDMWSTSSTGSVCSAWFVIYEGLGRDVALENLTPGLHLALRVRARSITLLDLAKSDAFSSCCSTSLLLHPSRNSTLTDFQANESILASVGLWSQATTPPLHISLPPVCPGAPPFPPKLLGRAKSNSLRLHWPKPKNSGGSSIVSYELCQVSLDSAQASCDWADCERMSPTLQSSSSSCSIGSQSSLNDVCPNVSSQPHITSDVLPLKGSGPTSATRKSFAMSPMNYHCEGDDDRISVLATKNTDRRSNCRRFTVSGRECSVNGLHPGRSYAFRVRARNRVGLGPWSGWTNVQTYAGVPGAPTHAPGVQYIHSDNKLVISWNPVLRVNGASVKVYILEWQSDNPRNLMTSASCETSQSPKKKPNHSPFENHLAYSSPTRFSAAKSEQSKPSEADGGFHLLYVGSGLSYELVNPQPACLMRFRVCAVNSAGSGPWSPVTTYRTAVAPPGQPYGLSLGEIRCNTAQVSWLIPLANGSPITSFTLELTLMDANDDDSATEASAKRVTEISAPSSCWLDADKQAKKLSASNTIDEYKPKTMGHIFSGLLPCTRYRLRIQASNAFGRGLLSGGLTFRTLPPHPNAPMFEKPTAITSSSVRLHWSLLSSVPPSPSHSTQSHSPTSLSSSSVQCTEQRGSGEIRSNETLGRAKQSEIQYTLQLYRPADSVWTILYEGPDTSYKVIRLTENTSFEFRLTASNCSGVSDYSAIQKIHTLRHPPQAVRGLKVTELGVDSCQIEWSAQTVPSVQPNSSNGVDPIVYVLHLMPVQASMTSTSAMPSQNQIYRGTQASCRVIDLLPNTEYVCRVFAVRLCQPDTLPRSYHGDHHGSRKNSATKVEVQSLETNTVLDRTGDPIDNLGCTSPVWRREVLSDSSDRVHELIGPSSASLVFTTRAIREFSRSPNAFCHLSTASHTSQITSVSHIQSVPKKFAPWSWLTSWFSSRRLEFFRWPFARHLSCTEVVASGDSNSAHRSNQTSPVMSSSVASSPGRRRGALSSNSTVSAIHVQQHSQPSSSTLVARSGSNSLSIRQRPLHWFRLSERTTSYLLLFLFILTTLLACVGVQIFLTTDISSGANTAQ